MASESEPIAKVAVLGSGVMGSRIAALLANGGLSVDLYDLPDDGHPTRLAEEGLANALNSRPPAFFSSEIARSIRCRSLEDLRPLRAVHWIVEAIVEDLDAKRELLARVDDAVAGSSTIQCISTNTSGLSVNGMSTDRSEGFRRMFMGVHFFNPPRYMKLVELVPCAHTEGQVLSGMARFLEQEFGKGVVECRDTPNFIANRVGVFALMDCLHRMQRSDLAAEEVDAVTGVLIGRPRSATLRLSDIIGLDVLADVASTAYDNLPDDRGRETFALPGSVTSMVAGGFLGEKTGGGFYRKGSTGEIEVLDLDSMQYRPRRKVDLGGEMGEVASRRGFRDRLEGLMNSSGRLAEFACGHLAEVVAYAAENGPEMASGVDRIDRAMRWGFNWEAGPFEVADMIGADRLEAQLRKRARSVPRLLKDISRSSAGAFYTNPDSGRQAFSFSESRHASAPGSGPSDADLLASGDIADAAENARLVRLGEAGVLIFSGKLNVIGNQSLGLVERTVAGEDLECLVLYGDGGNFSAGADLSYIVELSESGRWDGLESYVAKFQQACMAVRFAPFPVIAAARGLTLGGGCEFCLAAAARVVAAELRIGLVETAVGLIPGAGGCKEMARRSSGGTIDRAFRTIFSGRFSDNAHQGRQWGLVQGEDRLRMNDRGIVAEALRLGSDLASGYQPPVEKAIETAGDPEADRLQQVLAADRDEEKITRHEYEVGVRLAGVLCGRGLSPAGAREQDFLDLERETFLELCGMAATRERMRHMLKTGKPLRN